MSVPWFYLVRILRVCPWYEELEPVMRDQPMARPMAYQDSIDHSTLDLSDFVPLTQPVGTLKDSTVEDSEQDDDSEPYKGWIQTPPRPLGVDDQESKSTLDPLLTMRLGSPSSSLSMPANPSQADALLAATKRGLPHTDHEASVGSMSLPASNRRCR